MISDVYANSPAFLFGTPKAYTKQDENGAILISGAPSTIDICAFILHNPSWYKRKAKERADAIALIQNTLVQLMENIQSPSMDNIGTVLRTGIDSYRNLFKYAFLSQFISDEFLEVYLDFLKMILGRLYTKDIFTLKSNYVKQSLSDGVVRGDAKTWNRTYAEPHVWKVEMTCSSIIPDSLVLEAINDHANRCKLLRDYYAFLEVIPLVYQLSEEFFYVSSSINSFINWALVNLHRILEERRIVELTLEEFLELPLERVWELYDTIIM